MSYFLTGGQRQRLAIARALLKVWLQDRKNVTLFRILFLNLCQFLLVSES